MAEPARLQGRLGDVDVRRLLGIAAIAAFLLLAALPAATLAAPRPGESCPDATPAPGESDVCADVTGPDVAAGGGLDLGIVLPILAVVVAVGVAAIVIAFLVLRRRAAVPFAPAEPGEWWTCKSCGSTNVVGSARCYACGTWQA